MVSTAIIKINWTSLLELAVFYPQNVSTRRDGNLSLITRVCLSNQKYNSDRDTFQERNLE